jgi:hypothetical protein
MKHLDTNRKPEIFSREVKKNGKDYYIAQWLKVATRFYVNPSQISNLTKETVETLGWHLNDNDPVRNAILQIHKMVGIERPDLLISNDEGVKLYFEKDENGHYKTKLFCGNYAGFETTNEGEDNPLELLIELNEVISSIKAKALEIIQKD